MQVDLENLKIGIQEELSKVERQRRGLEEGLLAVQATERLAMRLKDTGQGDFSPAQKPEDSLSGGTLAPEKAQKYLRHTDPRAGKVDSLPTPAVEDRPLELLEFYVERGRMPTDEEKKKFVLGRKDKDRIKG